MQQTSCREHTIDNTAEYKRSHVTITSVHLMNTSLWVEAAKFQKFSVQGVAPHQPFFLSETSMNDLSCGIRMWARLSFVLSQSTHLTNRRTDRKALAILSVALHARLKNLKCAYF